MHKLVFERDLNKQKCDQVYYKSIKMENRYRWQK